MTALVKQLAGRNIHTEKHTTAQAVTEQLIIQLISSNMKQNAKLQSQSNLNVNIAAKDLNTPQRRKRMSLCTQMLSLTAALIVMIDSSTLLVL